MKIRDEAIEVAAAALFSKAGYAVGWDEGWGSDFEDIKAIYRRRAVAAIEAATPHLNRTITTAEELDALPLGSAVKHWESKHPRKDGSPLSEWLATGYEDAFETGELTLPAVVLWEPSA